MGATQDTYTSIASMATGEYKEKGSKFIAYAFPMDSVEAFNEQLKKLKKEHLKSRHHCYAYRIGLTGEPYRINDDGEPSGTAGKPIYGQLIKENLSDIGVIVVRYFGGVKLGTSGLIRSYKEATILALDNVFPIEKTVTKKVLLSFTYERLGAIMEAIKGIETIKTEKLFEDTPRIIMHVPQSLTEQTITQLKANMLHRSIQDITDDTEVTDCDFRVLET